MLPLQRRKLGVPGVPARREALLHLAGPQFRARGEAAGVAIVAALVVAALAVAAQPRLDLNIEDSLDFETSSLVGGVGQIHHAKLMNM